MANVNGNYKNKSKQLVVYSKGEALKSKIRVGVNKTKKFVNKKVIPSATKNYKDFISPTVGLFKKTGSALSKTGKFALKSGLLGIPGAIGTGLYYGGKAIVNKGEKTASRTPFRQYNKKGKWML
nr:hypothetical protein [uncultured Mediterranean phage uvMED]